MPTRFIKESCRSSKNLDKLTDFEERLWWRLITTADDFGRFMACPELVRSACFPFKTLPTKTIVAALHSLQTHDLIRLYSVDDRQYGEFAKWEKHQGKPRAKESKYPAFFDTQENHMLASAMHLHANVPGHSDTDTDTDLSSLQSLSSPIPNPEFKHRNSCADEFETFWNSYPKKVGRKAAQKAFQNALKNAQDCPTIDDLLEAISRQRASPQWAKEGGQYIPHPATWLNRGQWADKPPELTATHDPNGFLAGMQAFLERGD